MTHATGLHPDQSFFMYTFPRFSAEAWQTDSDQRTVFKVDYLAKLYDYRPATYVFLTESLCFKNKYSEFLL
jgi:hypothetical protein